MLPDNQIKKRGKKNHSWKYTLEDIKEGVELYAERIMMVNSWNK